MSLSESSRSNRRLGAEGEARAAEWYEGAGFEILDRNWRTRRGEIDLVCADTRSLVFCEVKTRSSRAFGTPADAVTAAKQRRLRALAASWLATHDVHRPEIRFDVASVERGRVAVIESAF